MVRFRNSRYRGVPSQQIALVDGSFEASFEMREFPDALPKGTTPHTVAAGETMESLAEAYYDDADKWYVIADANPEIFFPLDLAPGMTIKIPPKNHAVLA